jgi:hypothetical protein
VAVCGDGFHDPGEICYGTPIGITASDVTYDGQLADVDGDGDLDVVYLIGDQYVYHPLDSGSFGAARNGPTVFSTRMLAVNLDTDPHAELIDGASTTIELWNFDLAATTLYTRTGLQTYMTGQATVDIAVGNISGAQPNVVALQTSAVTVYNVDPTNGMLSYFAALGSITGAQAVAVGRIDADTLDDVMIARMTGITYHRSTSTGPAPEIALPVTQTPTGIAIGDTDGDGNNDVVYTTGPDVLGVMHSQGAGAFQSPTTTQVSNLQRPVTTANIDGDGRADVVALKQLANAIVIALGKADGTLTTPVEIPIAVPATYVHADADFNGDGMPDIVVTDVNSQTVLVLPSNP